jgi:hypothetical protein
MSNSISQIDTLTYFFGCRLIPLFVFFSIDKTKIHLRLEQAHRTVRMNMCRNKEVDKDGFKRRNRQETVDTGK